jgi:hypothetical protein
MTLAHLRVAVLALCAAATAQQGTSPAAAKAPPPAAMEEFIDDFSGEKLDPGKWQPYSMGGGPVAKLNVEAGELRMRGISGGRAGVRTVKQFTGDRFIAEAKLAKVGLPMPEPGDQGMRLGNAILTVLFGGDERNRIEWLLDSEGRFEAWLVLDGRGERLDNRRLGTKEKTPTLAIVRRGETIMFVLNGEVGLQKQVKTLPKDFHVMLYGFGSSENNWDYARVVTPKP